MCSFLPVLIGTGTCFCGNGGRTPIGGGDIGDGTLCRGLGEAEVVGGVDIKSPKSPKESTF